jgi:quercetin dioxygenase-like cupin family protein
VSDPVRTRIKEEAMTLEVIRIGGMDLRFLHSKETSEGSLDLFEMTVQPGAHVPVAHFHENWDETVYGLRGMSTWRVDGHDVELEPRRAIFIKRGVVHSFRNDTQEPTTCLNILTPGVLGPGYFREMAALIASGPPDPELVKATMLRHGLIPAAGF